MTHACPCGETDPRHLEFDHLENKERDISRLVALACSLQRLQKEIAKCQVLCSKCHRRKTAADFGWAVAAPDHRQVDA